MSSSSQTLSEANSSPFGDFFTETSAALFRYSFHFFFFLCDLVELYSHNFIRALTYKKCQCLGPLGRLVLFGLSGLPISHLPPLALFSWVQKSGNKE